MEQIMELILAKMDSFQQKIEANQEKMDAFKEEMREPIATSLSSFEVLLSLG
jgi:hypothetical protein